MKDADKPVRLSILIPAYNRPEMLSELLTSLETVTIQDCEVLIVDDVSPVDLRPIVEMHQRRDSRIRFIRNETNLGPTANFNKCISLARGAYFCILGDDETVLPGNFEKKLAILEAHPEIGFVYSRHFYTDANNQNPHLAVWPGMLNFSYIGGRDEFADLFPFNYISLHTVLYRRRLWEQYGGFDEAITECGNDWEMNLRYAFYSQTAYLDEPLLNVRLHEGTTTSKKGVTQSKLAEGRIQVWWKWLVAKPEPYVLSQLDWGRLRATFERDVDYWFKDRPVDTVRWTNEFKHLEAEAGRAAERWFTSSLTPPLLEFRLRGDFPHGPTWARVVDNYLQALTVADNCVLHILDASTLSEKDLTALLHPRYAPYFGRATPRVHIGPGNLLAFGQPNIIFLPDSPKALTAWTPGRFRHEASKPRQANRASNGSVT